MEQSGRNAVFWLAPQSLLSLLFCTTQENLPRDVTTHRGLGPPTSIINEESAPSDLPTYQSYGNIFSIEIPSFQVTIACVVDNSKKTAYPSKFTVFIFWYFL